MQITPTEKKAAQSTGEKYLGFFEAELIACNPTAKQIQKIYKLDELPEETAYTGTDKRGSDWRLIKLEFLEKHHQIPIEYRIFLGKDIAEYTKDGEDFTWYVNQWGETQAVTDKSKLWRSFTHVQHWDKDESKFMDNIDENGKPKELAWRKAHRGEVQLYQLLRKLVTQNWYEAHEGTNIFMDFNELYKGNIKDITNYIGTENFQSVVGMLEISVKDGEKGISYFQNCVDGAWMPGWKFKEANLTTQSNSWGKYESKDNSKGKNKEMYQFYKAVGRNKNITEFSYMHVFTPDGHLNATNDVIRIHDDAEINNVPVDNMDY